MLKFLKYTLPAVAGILLFLAANNSHATEISALSNQQMRNCLKKANDLPDIAVAESTNWAKQGGGDAAKLCHATALFHDNEFVKSAEDFYALAKDQKDQRQSALLYQQAGLAFSRAQDYKKSEDAYGKALSLEQADPDIWVARANERASAERYWDSIDDLDKALDVMPDMPEALRMRGQVWSKLGLDHNAEADFRHAGQVQAEEDVAAQNAKNKVAITPSATKVSVDNTGKNLRRGASIVADNPAK